jgi:hypothetical protein
MFSGILAEESEKLTWAKEHPELAEPPFALEDHPLPYGYQAGFSMYSYEIKYLAASYGVFDCTEDDRNWVLCAPAASGFLSAAFAVAKSSGKARGITASGIPPAYRPFPSP